MGVMLVYGTASVRGGFFVVFFSLVEQSLYFVL